AEEGSGQLTASALVGSGVGNGHEPPAARRGDDVASGPVTASEAVVTAPSPAAARDRARKEQLGFGFPRANRGALEAARSEVLAMLDLLDREDAAANRLRARPVAAKS